MTLRGHRRSRCTNLKESMEREKGLEARRVRDDKWHKGVLQYSRGRLEREKKEKEAEEATSEGSIGYQSCTCQDWTME
jgi:hypothetical protein